MPGYALIEMFLKDENFGFFRLMLLPDFRVQITFFIIISYQKRDEKPVLKYSVDTLFITSRLELSPAEK
ncbi:hypothetical protein BV494_22265 (plasmid) [Rahnella sikkimica]|uniref:Uncharacterized protein n=1 Tax=Rahnella sikkimica TaxID=1805933 RepID=A0A2L1UXI8_9GAMM|nr:hypothetical protein BV494_22265 [Rahnella sikkimica]